MAEPKRILIIEDDADIREALVELLSVEDFAVEAAVNGRVGLDLLRRGPLPSLILLDLTMPIMDGFQFRAEQLADPRLAAVPVVVMTADAYVEEKRIRIGAEHAIKKPLDIEVVVALIRKYLG